VKVLFTGEGPHDIGDSSLNPDQPWPARGVIPTLARRVCAGIAPESIALGWREIGRFSGSAQQRGFPGKVVAAALLAVRRFGCGATVAVADRDREVSRRADLEEGVSRSQRLFPRHPAVWGLAVESVEAWTLGVPEKIAEVLAIDVASVQNEYSRGVSVESMFQQSGRLEHRPKQLLERVARLKHREASTEFREAISKRTDPVALARACPQGFAPFADRLRRALRQA
jgi:hypothetical protein